MMMIDALPTFETAQSTARGDGEDHISHCVRTYRPSFPGVHLCGADNEENRFFTILDAPFADDEATLEAWQAVKAECEVTKDAADFTVDLNDGDGHTDDFWSNRQMLPRIAEILKLHGATL
jgi:hypothetical protein